MNQLRENSSRYREAGYCEHGFLTCKECTIWPPEKEDGSKKKKKTETPRKLQEEVLSSREIIDQKGLGGGRHVTEFISFRDDGAGVFKPKEGEEFVGRYAEVGTYYKRERAAYLVDQFLGFGLVPPTVIREIGDKVGSVQEFVSNFTDGFDYRCELSWRGNDDEKNKLWKKDLAVLRLFDMLIANSDRHEGNVIVKDGRVIAIDHGFSFDHRDSLRLYFEFQEVPRKIIQKVNKLRKSKEMRILLGHLLSELLREMDVICFFRRLDYFGEILDRKGAISNDDIRGCPDIILLSE